MPAPAPRVAALLLLCAAACVEAPADFYVHGVGVLVRTGAPFAREADLPARLEGSVAAALDYWGGGWEQLSGSRITLLDGPYVPCGGASGATGCWDDGEVRISASDPGAGTFRCVEQTVLVHEVGHAVIGDALHEDPRWMDFEAVRAALAGRLGYSEAGPADCELSVSVWRHPPAVP